MSEKKTIEPEETDPAKRWAKTVAALPEKFADCKTFAEKENWMAAHADDHLLM